jgi:TP901 family phage tail tape measure protein
VAATTVWSLLFKLEADGREMRGLMDDMDRRLASFEGSVNRSTRNVGAGFSQMSRGAGQVATGLDKIATRASLAAAGGLAFVINAAIDAEDAFAGVKKTVDEVDLTNAGSSFAMLREELRAMSREIPLSFEALAGLAEQAGALGIAAPNISSFVRTTALIGVTTDVSAEQAATSLGVLSNVLGLTEKDYERFGSTLVDLGNKGASTESQILAIADRAGAGAKLAHLSAAETLGWASAVANLGIEVEAGGTSLQTFFQKSLRFIVQGGDELEVYARTAGMSAKAFQTAFGKDASGTLAKFVNGLGELGEAERLAVLEALGFNDVRISRALLGLAGDADNLTSSLEIAQSAWEANSALGIEAAKRFETTASQVQILKNNFMDAAITIGEQLLPVLNELIHEGVAWLIDHRADIAAFGEDLAGWVRGAVAAAKDADFSGLIETMKGAAGVAKTAFDLFNGLPEPVKQIALAAIVANKVSGGAVFDIAKGLANVFGGALKTIHAAHVTVVGAGVGGGVPGAGGAPGMWKTVGMLIGVAVAAEVGFLVGQAITETMVAPARDFAQGQVDAVLASEDAGRIEHAIQVIEDQLHPADFAAQIALALDINGVRTTLEGQRDALLAQLEGMGLSREQAAAMLALTERIRETQDTVKDNTHNTANAAAAQQRDLQAQMVQYQRGNAAVVDQVTDAASTARRAEAIQNNLVNVTRQEQAALRTQAHQEALAQTAAADRVAARLRDQHATLQESRLSLGTIARKNFAPTINVNTTVRATIGAAGFMSSTSHVAVGGRGGFAQFAEGAWDVPATGLAMLHEHEMVIPRTDADEIRRGEALWGTQPVEKHVHIEVHGPLRDVEDTEDLVDAALRASYLMVD